MQSMLKLRNTFCRSLSQAASNTRQLRHPTNNIFYQSSKISTYCDDISIASVTTTARPFRNRTSHHLRSYSSQPSTVSSTEDYQTQRKPVYTLPFYGASDDELSKLSDEMVKKVVKAYGGLIRDKDTTEDYRIRLRKLTRSEYRKQQLTISGTVVSNRMNKSVVIAAKRRAYSEKLKLNYLKTRRFMAHDEFDLCREGDQVVIKSCRNLSRKKSHVVVQNFGDKTRPGVDDRRIVLEDDQKEIEAPLDEEKQNS